MALDAAAGWWVEVWNLRNATAVVRPLPGVFDASFEAIADDIGAGSITIAADHPDLAAICDPRADPPVETLIRVHQHNRVAYAFLARSPSVEYGDDGKRRVRISGPGQEEILRWGSLLARDYNAQPAQARTWIYGSDREILPWGTFEDTGNLLGNGDFEDGNEPPWRPAGPTPGTIYSDTTYTHAGAYSMKVTPTVAGDGVAQSVHAEAGWLVFGSVWVRDASGSGSTCTLELLASDWSVLDSDSTTLGTTWTQLSVSGTADGSTTLAVRLSAGTMVDFWVDDAELVADPGPWEVGRATVALNTTTVRTGSRSMAMTFEAGGDVTWNGGIIRMPVEPNREYTLSCWVSGATGMDVSLRLRLGGVASADSVTLTGAGNWHQLTVTGTAGADQFTGRAALQSADASAFTVFVDDFSMRAGQPASTAGKIVIDVLTAIQSRSTLPFLTWDFTASLDSNGDAWPGTLAMELDPTLTLRDLLDRLVGLGYEFELAPVDWRASNGTTGWELRLFPAGGAGVDYSSSNPAPTVLPGPAVLDVDTEVSAPERTVTFVEGKDGVWSTAAKSSGWLTALERREELVTNWSMLTSGGTDAVAARRLDQMTKAGTAFTVTFSDLGDPLPYFDFLPHDTVRVQIPDRVAGGWYRAVAATWEGREDGSSRWVVDFGAYRW